MELLEVPTELSTECEPLTTLNIDDTRRELLSKLIDNNYKYAEICKRNSSIIDFSNNQKYVFDIYKEQYNKEVNK